MKDQILRLNFYSSMIKFRRIVFEISNFKDNLFLIQNFVLKKSLFSFSCTMFGSVELRRYIKWKRLELDQELDFLYYPLGASFKAVLLSDRDIKGWISYESEIPSKHFFISLAWVSSNENIQTCVYIYKFIRFLTKSIIIHYFLWP